MGYRVNCSAEATGRRCINFPTTRIDPVSAIGLAVGVRRSSGHSACIAYITTVGEER
jgi:hypothetical protein